jgi:hypothetical protein
MADTEDSRRRSAQTLAPHRWRGARILEAVFQINEHLVSALVEMASDESASAGVASQHSAALRQFDAAACKRAARIPVLLVDLHFGDDEWWEYIVQVGFTARKPDHSMRLPAIHAAELTREALITAWLAVQHARECASLLFGMSAGVVDRLAAVTPRQLSRISERSSHELSIRWQSNREFWRKLLHAGRSGIAHDISEVHLLGLQLLGGDLMTAGQRS